MSKPPYLVQRLADDLGGTIDQCERLPDGSGFATMSLPLPADHWLTQDDGKYDPPPMPFRMGVGDPRRDDWAEKIRQAGRYAVRSATMKGKEMDFDPDALLQNLVVGMLGYWTADGLDSQDSWGNPDPVPPLFSGGGAGVAAK